MKKLLSITLLIILLLTACRSPEQAVTPTPTPPSPTPTIPSTDISEPGSMEQRLALVLDRLEEQRETFHVPGMALAVVKNDEVILTHGFGMADFEEEIPVTPETGFAIGSCTKAFTSTLIGMLVDEGKMDWDDPATDYLPYFTMKIESDDSNEEITIRDMLSHQTGYTRMGLLFANSGISREEILHAMPMAEPWAPFRESFHYTNVMYMAAGEFAARVENTSWDALLHDRIFVPLNMNSSSTSIDDIDNKFAHGYLWEDSLNGYVEKPMRNVDNIGPAGSINSNVIDMAQWLKLQLGQGEFDGERLVSKKQIEETWMPQISISPEVGYALGWMVHDWEGHKVIEHGGNVDGFSAEVAMIPELDIGYVLLTNASASPLQQTSQSIVWDTLLGEWEDVDISSETEQYDRYTGEYIANFGSFQNEILTVLIQNDNLAVDIPGQMVFELKNPDEEGKWYFAITDEVAVSFDEDADGTITGMKMYQSGLTFELPRKGFEAEAEVPLEELNKYLGSYRSEELEVTAKVVTQNNRLAIDWPGEMVYELYPPNEKGIHVFRISERFSLRFNENSDGIVESLTYFQDDDEYEMLRVENEDESLPTVIEILLMRDTVARVAALEKMGDFRITSSLYSLQSGVKGSTVTTVSGSERYRIDSDYGKFGQSMTIVTDNNAWEEFTSIPMREIYGDLLEQAKRGHPTSFYGDWYDYYDSVFITRSAEIEGTDVYVLQLVRGELPSVTIYIDTEYGDVLKAEMVIMTEGGVGIPVEVLYEDYKEVNGIRLPSRTTSSNEASGRTIITFEKIEAGLSIDDTFFNPTTPLQE